MLSFFNRKKKIKELEVPKDTPMELNSQPGLTAHLMDDFFIIKLPNDLVPFESDKFRAKNNEGTKLLTITNVGKAWQGEVINKSFFEKLKLKLYDEFVTEGEYEPYNDLKVTDEFICKSFKVDEETQYYFTSARIIDGQIICTDFILREIGDYNRKAIPTLQIINKSIKLK